MTLLVPVVGSNPIPAFHVFLLLTSIRFLESHITGTRLNLSLQEDLNKFAYPEYGGYQCLNSQNMLAMAENFMFHSIPNTCRIF
jgi:hypothetical protein